MGTVPGRTGGVRRTHRSCGETDFRQAHEGDRMTATQRITRDDIEAKFRQIKGDVDTTAEKAKPIGLAVAVAAFVGMIGLAYVFGRRKERKRRTFVEIRRV